MMKALLPIFWTIFLAELGDKTQLATLLFATDKQLGRWQVFIASATALAFSSLLAVLIGGQLGRWVSHGTMKILAGIGFIAIGIWTLWKI
jgi:putative Ca2+/H+ antiporter (TMEM165/GDT1 family)